MILPFTLALIKCTERRKKTKQNPRDTSTEAMHNVFGHVNLNSSGTAVGKVKF